MSPQLQPELTIVGGKLRLPDVPVTAPNILTLPDEFTLELSRGGHGDRNCHVVWRTKLDLGVEFVADAPAVSQSRPMRSRASLATA